MLLRCFKLVFNKYTLARLIVYFKIAFYPKQSIENTLSMQTELSIHQDSKTGSRPFEVSIFESAAIQRLKKPVVIQFCTNRCHTRWWN